MSGTDGGYRQYSEAGVRTRQFINRGPVMGFAVPEIAELVSLWHNRRRTSVKRVEQKHVDELVQCIKAIQTM